MKTLALDSLTHEELAAEHDRLYKAFRTAMDSDQLGLANEIKDQLDAVHNAMFDIKTLKGE